ncbi:hypothetical protein TCAL_15874 [Tigriopus californicus]|uniref:Uncharacterized protein n=1 Tax=Tigriopus californicus TaxID=6832 RepID=A0A553NP54_TIGCA|nr:hypothetical protein TCAL_15874 [Tigriopus californicus]
MASHQSVLSQTVEYQSFRASVPLKKLALDPDDTEKFWGQSLAQIPPSKFPTPSHEDTSSRDGDHRAWPFRSILILILRLSIECRSIHYPLGHPVEATPSSPRLA